MTDAYVIEISGSAVGIIARDLHAYRFYAATHRFNALEGKVFSGPRDAERAAKAFAAKGIAASAGSRDHPHPLAAFG